ncbi:hypothetical protein F4820DRAFT_431791 [Hypoxylon rubiginosum]|uniref:Uncharacterized protein n=1 Tax=Hypoxylon rubiginosum TaxID=110542 RepID=A0ACB9YRI3_9PEZI|nr:hypothetical protein F4820DRAFT_431791 [Hypoxylon rubiginosum]
MAAIHEAKYDMIRRLRVADYVTLSNAFCGVISMFCSMQQSFVAAHAFIFLGYEFDRYDGMVARYRNECSEMGKELDSLSDLVTFGTAPAIMLHSIGFRTTVDQTILAFYVLCCVARLARFNVATHLTPKDKQGKSLYHEGLPTAYAALIVSTLTSASVWMGWTTGDVFLAILFPGTWCEVHLAMIPVAAFCALMISKRLKLRFDGGSSIPAATVIVFSLCWWFSPS